MTHPIRTFAPAVLQSLALFGLALLSHQVAAAQCEARSGANVTPVVELFTSEGCSSCPPADRWLSTLKGSTAVVQAFHVGYWDYIGWLDRFAAPSHTTRQRELASANRLGSIYTPQVVRNGHDWRQTLDATRVLASPQVAQAAIVLQRSAGASSDSFEARVSPQPGVSEWAAYWTVTEHGHSSKVKTGENAGEFLKHDFVVRQYVPVGQYSGERTLRFNAIAADPAHPRQINLVVLNPKTLEPLQAVSLQCGGGA
jgi:hypothetical protein